MNFKVGDHSLQGNFVVLSSHERNLPLFLFGMDLLMGPLQGVAVVPDVKNQLDRISVYFGIDWSVGYPCEEIVRIKHPPIFQSNISLIEDVDGTLVEEYLSLVTSIDPYTLFDSAPLTENAVIFGGSGDKEEEVASDDNLYEEYCQGVQDDQSGFQDCPLPVVQVAVAASGSPLSSNIKVLIDSGATLNLISRSFVKTLLATHGQVVSNAMRDCVIADLPVVRVASGQRVTAIGCIDLRLMFSEGLNSELVPFFIFPSLPVQAIIGHSTNTRWKAILSWETKTWQVTPHPSAQRVIVPWHSSAPHWRAPLRLLTNGDFVVPARSHSKVPVVNPFETDYNNATWELSDSFHRESPSLRAWLRMVLQTLPPGCKLLTLLTHL